MSKPQPDPLETLLSEYASLLVQQETIQGEARRHAEKFRLLEAKLTQLENHQDEVFKRLQEEAAKTPAGPTFYTACGALFHVAEGRVQRIEPKDVSPLPY